MSKRTLTQLDIFSIAANLFHMFLVSGAGNIFILVFALVALCSKYT
jgi:hypothetical protein